MSLERERDNTGEKNAPDTQILGSWVPELVTDSISVFSVHKLVGIFA